MFKGTVINVNIGKQAPDFTATTTFGPLKLSDNKGQWVILFSHPGDFTLHIVGKYFSK
ncbi:redoxin domain-containing protein [Lacrimispora sp.]|uniref:redoxin domain-containing protein n=1 Tax=Lacrimispora sp. TaxID=2719234 RepID=UPI0028A754CA|nr:redoxin domain-containing protein [Lacrimispora sp.]